MVDMFWRYIFIAYVKNMHKKMLLGYKLNFFGSGISKFIKKNESLQGTQNYSIFF